MVEGEGGSAATRSCILYVADGTRTDQRDLLERLLEVLPRLASLSLSAVQDVWIAVQRLLRLGPPMDPYEALEYESTLELLDRVGEKATFTKREKVRYLQDNVIAYQDQAWGDGEILLDYRCSPGVSVDQYRYGSKTHVLISRREVKSGGDVDEFHIQWGIRRGFLQSTSYWETHICHSTRRVRISIIFPSSRPPRHTALVETNHRQSRDLETSARVRLPDGRWQVTWGTSRPRLHENYIIQWEW